MRRRTLHTLFALATLACAGLVAVASLRLRQHQALDAAIAHAEQTGGDAAPSGNDTPREVRLAQAGALARRGEAEAAARLLGSLIEPGRVDDIGRAALFNLGNLHLRQALDRPAGPGAPATPDPATGPLVELAKQRYRDLLRLAPDDWDARHNLERALRLAPEEQEAIAEPDNEPVERRNVQLRGMKAGDLP